MRKKVVFPTDSPEKRRPEETLPQTRSLRHANLQMQLLY